MKGRAKTRTERPNPEILSKRIPLELFFSLCNLRRTVSVQHKAAHLYNVGGVVLELTTSVSDADSE